MLRASVLLAAGLALAPHPAVAKPTATSSGAVITSQQTLPSQAQIEAAATYNLQVAEAVNAYLAIIADQETYDLFLAADPIGGQGDDSVLPRLGQSLTRLRAEKARVDETVTALPATSPTLGRPGFDRALREAKPYVLRLGRLVDEVLATWDAQLAALRAGDLRAYQDSVNNELDTTSIMLDAENGLARLQQAAQDQSAPTYWLMGAVVGGNEVLIAFIELINAYEQSTSAADAASYEALTAGLEKMRTNIEESEKRTGAFCGQRPNGPASEPWQALCASFQRSNATERRLLAVLGDYGEIARTLVDQTFGEAEQERLLAAEAKLGPLVDQRVALQLERVPMGQALLAAMR